jgi:hypothetical protein
MSQCYKNNLRTKRRKKRISKTAKSMLIRTIKENVCDKKCTISNNALAFVKRFDFLTERRTKRFAMRCVKD